MRCIHVASDFDESYGGIVTTLSHLAVTEQRQGVETVIVSVKTLSAESNSVLDRSDVPCVSVPRTIPGGFYYARGLGAAIRRHIHDRGDVVIHLHTAWRYPAYCVWRIARELDIPYLCTAHSALYAQSMRRSAWKKHLAWWTYTRRVLDHAACIHATEPREASEVGALVPRAQVVLIPTGVTVSRDTSVRSHLDVCRRLGLDPTKRYMLFLSRIHPRKGLHTLLEAWASIRRQNDDWRLLVVGPTEDRHYWARAKDLIRAGGLSDSVIYKGVLVGRAKEDAYAAAELFVLPSLFENFGHVVAEALAAGCAVITTTETPWQDVATHGAGWIVEPSLASLRQALADALRCTSAELRSRGRRGVALVAGMDWDTMARRMIDVYAWMLGRRSPPESVVSSDVAESRMVA